MTEEKLCRISFRGEIVAEKFRHYLCHTCYCAIQRILIEDNRIKGDLKGPIRSIFVLLENRENNVVCCSEEPISSTCENEFRWIG